MPTKPDAAGLFEEQSKSSCIVVNVKGADAEIQGTGSTGAEGPSGGSFDSRRCAAV